MKRFPTVLLPLLLLFSCGGDVPRTIDREILFSLEIGKGPEQFDLLQVQTARHFRNRIASRDGRIFLSNGQASRIMEFTGFGDMLWTAYDPALNPESMLPAQGGSQGATRTSLARTFEHIGEIAVGAGRTLLVEEQMEGEGIWDDDFGVRLRSRVLRFTGGVFQDVLGQEGLGGTRFPRIERMDVRPNGDMVIVSRVQDGRVVFWYDAAGALVYEVRIGNDRLPVPDRDRLLPVLESIIPDPVHDVLHLKLDYYEHTGSELGGRDISDVFSMVFRLDLETGMYRDPVEIPSLVTVARNFPAFEDEEVQHLYRLVGIGPDGHLFLTARTDSAEHVLLILDPDGSVAARRRIDIEDETVTEKHLSVSPEGILVGLLGRRERVDVVWWRTDRLIGRSAL